MKPSNRRGTKIKLYLQVVSVSWTKLETWKEKKQRQIWKQVSRHSGVVSLAFHLYAPPFRHSNITFTQQLVVFLHVEMMHQTKPSFIFLDPRISLIKKKEKAHMWATLSFTVTGMCAVYLTLYSTHISDQRLCVTWPDLTGVCVTKREWLHFK